MNTAKWKQHVQSLGKEGLFSLAGTLTPDFWLELRHDDGHVVGAVGDIRFSNESFGILDKGAKVQRYAASVFATRSGTPLKSSEAGFVIHCSNDPAVQSAVEADRTAPNIFYFSFVPTHPADGTHRFEPSDETVAALEQYLDRLRSEYVVP